MAIVDAGFILQIDDPGLCDRYGMIDPDPGYEEYRRTEAMRVVTPEILRFVTAMDDPAADAALDFTQPLDPDAAPEAPPSSTVPLHRPVALANVLASFDHRARSARDRPGSREIATALPVVG